MRYGQYILIVCCSLCSCAGHEHVNNTAHSNEYLRGYHFGVEEAVRSGIYGAVTWRSSTPEEFRVGYVDGMAAARTIFRIGKNQPEDGYMWPIQR